MPWTLESPRVARWSLLGIMLLGGGLRLLGIGQSLWLDELHTSWVVAGDWSEVASRATWGNQSPLYFWCVRLIVQVVGADEWSLRALSVIAGIGLLPAAAALTTAISGRRTAGLLAALLLAVHRDALFYSQEARPYGALQLVAVLHVLVLCRLIDRPTVLLRGLWIVGIPLLFHLHYTAALIVLAELIGYVAAAVYCRYRGQPPAYRWLHVGLDLTVAAVGCIPAVPQLLGIWQRAGAWQPYLRLPTLFQIATLWSWHLLIGIPVLAWGVSLLSRRVSSGKSSIGDEQSRTAEPSQRFWPLLLAWTLLPPLALWTISATGWVSAWLPRYAIGSAAGGAAVGAVAWSRLRGVWIPLLTACILLAAVVVRGGVPWQLAYDGRVVGDRQENWRALVTRLNDIRKLDEPVYLVASLVEDEQLAGDSVSESLRDYCRFPLRGLYAVAGPDDLIRPVASRHAERFRDIESLVWLRRGDSGRGWIVIRGGPALRAAVQRDLQQAAETERLTFHGESFGRLTLVRVATR